MVNEKVTVKDMALTKQFLGPFKWDFLAVDREKLGPAADLLTECLNSDEFWSSLKSSHGVLKLKYPSSNKL